MNDPRMPRPVLAMGALTLAVALPSLACAQSETRAAPRTPTTQSAPSDSDAASIHADNSLTIGGHVEIGSDDANAEHLPLLSAAIEPISFRVLRETENRPDTTSASGASQNAPTASRLEPAPEGGEDLRLADRLWINVGRNSALLDGGIAAQRGIRTDPVRGFAASDRDFDLYGLSLRWAALSPGPLELSLIGGVRAIQSVGGMWRTETRPAGTRGRSGLYETYDEDRSTVAMPVVGGDVRVRLGDGVTLSTSAATHSSGSSDTFLDLLMETSIDLGDGIGFHAGYQEVRSVFDAAGTPESFSDSGLFARLTIEF